MAIYEEFIGASRDDFKSLEDANRNYQIRYNENFNFAYDVMDVLADRSPDKLAMLWVSNEGEEKRFTYEDLRKMSNKAANYFNYMGIKKGDRVMLVLKRNYFFWICALALHKIGAVVLQATNMLRAKDYVYRCNVGDVVAVVASGDGMITEYFDEGEPEYKTIKYKFVIGHKQAGNNWIDFEDGFEKANDEWVRPSGELDTKATDIMLMAFSSGTSGYPKIITHDYRYPLGHIMTGVFWHRVVDGGIHFTISDTGWLKSLWGKFYGQWFGESAVFVYDFEKFEAKNILHMLEKYKITTFCAPPTMYRMLLLEDVASYDLSSLTHCNTAGEALNAEIFNRWYDITGKQIYEGYGQTETTLTIGTIYPWTKPVPGSMGLPVPGYDVHILDENDQSCTRGQVGEICIRVLSKARKTPGLIDSYNFSKEDTLKSLHDGFFHTGDTAYRDEMGLFRFEGRNDDVIKSSGYRIGPFEIESVLVEHPAVQEVAVTGIPDKLRGFAVKATIVLAKGYEASEELTKELQNFVKENTAPYKYPRVIEYVSELPKTFNGKIRRREIRDNDMKKANEE